MARPNHRFAGILTLVSVLGLAGCTMGAPQPVPDDTGAASSPSASGSAAPAPSPEPTLVAGGTADQNLPYFSRIVAGVWSGADRASGRAYIDALTAGGFDKKAMQVTADQSTVGNAAESIQFSVRLGDSCLVGQVGPSTGDPVTAVLPGLASGGCLIGQTRAIDW